MPCVQLNSESTFPALRGIFVKTDLRTKCLLCAAILVVLPLEIHHLLAAFAGAAGYMLLQMLEPAVQRQPVKPRAVKKDRSVATPPPTPLPERRLPRRGFTAAEDEKWSQLRSKATPTAQPPAVKPEVRRPSVMPVQAPRFAASGFEAEVVELLTAERCEPCTSPGHREGSPPCFGLRTARRRRGGFCHGEPRLRNCFWRGRP